MNKITRVKVIFAAIMILSGVLIFSYPFIGQYFANKNATVAVENIVEEVEEMEVEKIDAIKEAAKARNEMMNDVEDLNEKGAGEKNESYLDLVSTGSAIGYITIPKIDLKLPIYEGTTDSILLRGIGHITETSYPIGGKSTHSVLTGHRGMSNAELFTNLDKLEKGNQFYLHVLDEVLAYEVDQIKAVLPEDISDLDVIEEQDLCTLVTCTPLGINSHRLLVRGHRVEYTGEDDGSHSMYQAVHTGTAMQRLIRIWPWLALAALIVLGIELFLCMAIIRRMRERMEED